MGRWQLVDGRLAAASQQRLRFSANHAHGRAEGHVVNHSKHLILAQVESAELRESLKFIPGAYFQVARETVADSDDKTCVLWRVVELYGSAVEQIKRRADAYEAKLAESRRSHLSLAYSEPPASPADTSY